jgi:hypothetical protein
MTPRELIALEDAAGDAVQAAAEARGEPALGRDFEAAVSKALLEGLANGTIDLDLAEPWCRQRAVRAYERRVERGNRAFAAFTAGQLPLDDLLAMESVPVSEGMTVRFGAMKVGDILGARRLRVDAIRRQQYQFEQEDDRFFEPAIRELSRNGGSLDEAVRRGWRP